MKQGFRKGFTVVELMVVVAVIALLATVAILSYQSAIKTGDDAKRQAEFNDIRNAVELYDSRKGALPVCSGDIECDISQVVSQLGVSGLQTLNQDGSPIRYMSTNEAPKSWAIRMYDKQTESYCKMGSNIRSGWWTTYGYCW